jgi:hypothetical protein
VATCSVATPPGTKLLLKGPAVKKGLVILEPSVVEVLGGAVGELVEEWQLKSKVCMIESHQIPYTDTVLLLTQFAGWQLR